MKNEKLTQGAVHKHLFRIAFPALWGVMSVMGFQLVDSYFISILGTEPLAALSFSFPITFLFFSISISFGSAVSSISSRLIGSGQVGKVRRIVPHTYMLAGSVSFIITSLTFLFHDHIFTLLGASGALLENVRAYMVVWLIGAIPSSLVPVSNGTMRAFGDSKNPAIILAVSMGSNIILDPFLIFGLGPFPALGIQGAALATALANIITATLAIYFIYKHKKLICVRHIVKPILFLHSAKQLLRFALPNSLSNSISPIVNSFVISLLSASGAHAVAAYGVVTRIETFVLVPFFAILMGAAPIIGQNWGAKQYKRVREVFRLVLSVNIIWSSLLALLLSCFAYPLISLFSKDPEVIHYALLFFRIVPFSYAFGNLVQSCSSAFNAMGKPSRSFFLTITRGFVFTIPAVYTGYSLNEAKGLFIAMAIINFSAGLFFFYWSKTKLDKEIGTRL